MKWLKVWTLLSMLTLLLAAGCNAKTAFEQAATEPANDETTESEPAAPQPDLPTTTAVPPPTGEITRNVRLTPATTPGVEIVATVESTAVFGEVPEAIMAAVYEKLITTENVLREDITIAKAEAVTWSDGSLGCPQPGAVYTQAIVPGYWIVLAVNGRTYDYRAAENGYFTPCQTSQPPSPPIAGTPIS